MEKYVYLSATELARMIRNGEASSYDIVAEYISRIRARNSELNALIAVFEEEAIREAKQCDEELKQGVFRGPLHGVPVTIKEQFWMKGLPCTINAEQHRDFIPQEDAVIVSRIRRSGAIIIGRTNVPRYLLNYQVVGDIYPEGKNPYNTAHTPGGSTGGGAAALAAGFTPLELGGDFGGSIRVPSSFCGVYGLKPTERTVPLHGNTALPKNSRSFLVHMAQAGPLARSIDDLELLWKIIRGPYAGDRTIAPVDWQLPTGRSISDYRIAWTDGWPGYKAGREVSSALDEWMKKLSAEGARVDKRIPDDTLHGDSLKLFVKILPYVIAQDVPWYSRTSMKRELRRTLMKGVDEFQGELNRSFRMKADHYGEVLLTRSQITERWENFFNQYDFLISPVAFGPAFVRCPIGSRIHYDGKEMNYLDYVWPYVGCFNASGHPVVSIPLGLAENGLPIGVQITGPYWSEPELLSFARKASQFARGFIRPNGY